MTNIKGSDLYPTVRLTVILLEDVSECLPIVGLGETLGLGVARPRDDRNDFEQPRGRDIPGEQS